jgi:hypothetical protein
MEFIEDSTLTDYAVHFWRRERKKHLAGSDAAQKAETAFSNPVACLQEHHKFKLPYIENGRMRIARLNRDDIERLLIHDYMPSGQWMKDHGLVPDPYTRNLKELADVVVKRGYFERLESKEVPQAHYREWQSRGTLRNAISCEDRVLIECAGRGEYEIVDGWGRLLPFMALVISGYDCFDVEAFVATPQCWG